MGINFYSGSFRENLVATIPLIGSQINTKFKIKTFCNAKGGTGKTTISSQVAMRASTLGLKTLIIDLDPQAQTTHVLGLTVDDSLYTIGDVFDQECMIENTIVQVTPFLSLIPSSLNISTADRTLDKLSNREKRLKSLLTSLRAKFDLIIIDTNPAPSTLNVNAFLAADELCIITATDLLSVRGLGTLFDILDDLKEQYEYQPSIKIVPNLFDGRDRISRESLAFLRQDYAEFITKAVIRKNTDIREAQKLGQSIWQYNRNSHGAMDLATLTDELLNPENLNLIREGGVA